MDKLQFPKSIEQELFIKSEYLKRHFENNADPKTIEWLKEECFSPTTSFSEDIQWKINIVRECIIQHEKNLRDELYVPSIEIPFQISDFSPWVEKLFKISQKYKIYAPELLFPFDMEEVLMATKHDTPLPKQRPFDDEPHSDTIFQEYGYRTRSKNDKSLTIELDFSDSHPSSPLAVQRISFEIAMFKLTHNISLTEIERNQLKDLLISERSGGYRQTSFYNRIIGLFAWDAKKKSSSGFKDIKQYLLQKKMFFYNEKFCTIDQCGGCSSQDDCTSSFKGRYRLAANCIQNMKVLPASMKLKQITPNPGSPFLQRYSLSLFSSY